MKKWYWSFISALLLSICIFSIFSFRSALNVSGPPVNLYLHLDKSVYQPGETVWFTGYILNRDAGIMQAQNTLYAELVDIVTRKPILQQRFLIKDGLSKGFLSLPDSLIEGDYWVLAYTNAWLEQGPQPVFRQLISLRTGYVPPFKISAPTVLPASNDDTLRVRYKISTSYNGIAASGRFEYTVFSDAKPISSGIQTVDAFGEVTILLDKAKVAGKDLQLAARVSREGLTKNFVLPVTEPLPSTADAGSSHPAVLAIRSGQQASHELLADRFADSPMSPPALPSSPVDISIRPDSAEYHQRSKVTLHIRIRDSAGNRLPAIFSLAVVAAKKLKPKQMPSITEYADHPATISAAEAAIALPAGDSSTAYNGDPRMPDHGYVLCDDQAPKRPISLTIFGNVFASMTTDSSGRFELPQELLVTPVGAVNTLSVAEKSVDRYKIFVQCKADTLNKQLASIYQPFDLRQPEPLDTDESILLSRPGLLKAALVKQKVANGYDFLNDEFRSNRCDTDFVDMHSSVRGGKAGVLNCPYGNPRHPWPDPHNGHPVSREKPKEGEQYLVYQNFLLADRMGGGILVPVRYHCTTPPTPPFMKSLQSILLEKPFPLLDTVSRIAHGSGLQSTLLWTYALSTLDKGEVTVSFYTDDLTGSFSCVLQGVSTAGVISQRSSFAVKPSEY
ncbi:MAG TPA: hypothetical protein VHE34_09315 [Puia sp.]|uniref:hypothetical protein n=1 Tax=Puia sp. TaxID=2045100 RepID=UPI002CEA4FDB|nr:hypothetical protein [Puia sp.]HVU95412.1 hypothetical protein [Puia sp.]